MEERTGKELTEKLTDQPTKPDPIEKAICEFCEDWRERFGLTRCTHDLRYCDNGTSLLQAITAYREDAVERVAAALHSVTFCSEADPEDGCYIRCAELVNCPKAKAIIACI